VSHLGAEVFADAVAGEPGAGTPLERGGPVGGVGFGTDDDDPMGGERSERFSAATREVAGLDHQQVGRIPSKRVGELLSVFERFGSPAAVLTGEQFRDQPA
jgi:hypothetical protein